MKTLFFNIEELAQVRESVSSPIQGKEMKNLPTIKDAYLLVEDEEIIDYGEMSTLNERHADRSIDARGQFILPAWCDSHSHLVYAGNREGEFVDRINGLSYEEIAAKGGGILNSAQRLQNSSEMELFEQASSRMKELMRLGTGALEIKSGYGLTTESELKMLRVIKLISASFPVAVKATFLGAHAFPTEFKNQPDLYIDRIIKDMLPKVAEEGLAEYIDVFCEKGYFNIEQTDRILKAGRSFGLIPKVHVNQFNSFGGIQCSIENKALTVDHLEVLSDEDLQNLLNSEVLPVALPTCSYFLSIPYTPARKIIDAGLPLVLASDYNPGSTPSGNMNFVVATACIKMRMTPNEAINAATINGAFAMGLENSHGSITRGKKANLILTKQIPSLNYLPYSFGSNLIDQVMINGEFVS